MTLLLLILILAPAGMPPVAPADTLTLSVCYEAAEAHFPLARRSVVAERAAALEVENIAARYRPSLSLEGQGLYHSAVPELPASVPGLSSIPHDQYKAALNLNQVVYDGGLGAVARRLAAVSTRATDGEIDVALHDLKERINETYFGVLQQEAALSTLAVLREELAARRRALAAQIGEGMAPAGAVDVLEVELLSVDQQITSAEETRRGALDALEVLTGLDVPDDVTLALPDVDVDAPWTGTPDRPQYRVFEASRERLSLQREMVGRERRPTVAGFATAAYGRPPGMDIFETELSPFYSLGLRVSWSVWDWHASAREQALLELQVEVVDAQEDAFTQGVQAAGERIWRDVERLRTLIEQDEQIVALRARIAERAAEQLENGVISATDYLLEQHARHRAELAREQYENELRYAMVRYLTTLGLIDEAL